MTTDDAPPRVEVTGSRGASGRRRLGHLIALVLSVAAPLGLGAAGGVITAGAIPGWYAELAKPAWDPPSWLFGPVWTTLYIAMGIAAWRVWRLSAAHDASTALKVRVRSALLLYGVQLLINASWSPVFFGLKRVDIALIVIVLMLAAIVETVRRFNRLDRTAAALLLPYLAWVSFATVLNASIWLLNR